MRHDPLVCTEDALHACRRVTSFASWNAVCNAWTRREALKIWQEISTGTLEGLTSWALCSYGENSDFLLSSMSRCGWFPSCGNEEFCVEAIIKAFYYILLEMSSDSRDFSVTEPRRLSLAYCYPCDPVFLALSAYQRYGDLIVLMENWNFDEKSSSLMASSGSNRTHGELKHVFQHDDIGIEPRI